MRPVSQGKPETAGGAATLVIRAALGRALNSAERRSNMEDNKSTLAGAPATDWARVSPTYRAFWQQRHGKPGEKWEDFEPAYRFSWTMRSNAFYTGRRWDQVAADFQRNWELLHPDLSWERYGPLVHDSWDYWGASPAERLSMQPAQR
jgi:hypothetical protein